MQDIASVKDKDGQLYKVLVIGDYAVGASLIFSRDVALAPWLTRSAGRQGALRLCRLPRGGELMSAQTSLIRRYTEGVFTPNYKLTIGVDFAVKTLQWTDGSTINLQLWCAAAVVSVCSSLMSRPQGHCRPRAVWLHDARLLQVCDRGGHRI